MSKREIYAACIYGCLSFLAIAFGGLWGLILMNAGFWISAVDLGWIDDWFDQKPVDSQAPEVNPGLPEELPPNVVRLPVRPFKHSA